jgi:outer membrane protein assembly factor BamB
MKRKILRNIAAVSLVFIVTFAIMLTTTYFQVKPQTALKTEILETLKRLNDENASDPVLQEQIRELDLMSRKAYFVRSSRMTVGVYILLGMFATLVVSLHLLYAGSKNIPAKRLDAVDEWIVKTNARKYVTLGATTLLATALVFAGLSSPHLVSNNPKKDMEKTPSPPLEVTDDETAQGDGNTDRTVHAESSDPPESPDPKTEPEAKAVAETPTVAAANPQPTQSTQPATESPAPRKETPKTAHNGFRGNNSNGISPARKLPLKWDLSAGVNIAWKTETPRKGFNSPIINGSKVFMSGADAQARELYCFDLDSGKILWTLAADNIQGSPSTVPKTTDDTGLAASSAVTNGKQVCAIFATGDLICADTAGRRLWAKNLGVPDNHYGYASSLLVFGNLLIVQYDNNKSPRVAAFDIATGVERWSKNRTGKISWSSPIIARIAGKSQLVLSGNPHITSYNPDNGEEYWRVECLNGEVGSSPCSAADVVYGASEYATLIAINGADGSTLWKANDYLPEVSSPVATKDNVFLATSYGVVACYDAKTGELKKIHELSEEFYSSPLIAEGRVFLFSNSGKMYIFSANSEFNLIDSFATGERTFSTPALTDGKIVVRTENSLYCVYN